MRRPDIYAIEGEPVTIEQIAARVGIATNTAHARMKKLRTAPGAITWRALKKGRSAPEATP